MGAPHTYQVEVEGIGTFTFRRRTMGDTPRVTNRALGILGGEIPHHSHLFSEAMKLAELEVLTMSGPDGWGLDALDPLNPDDVARFELVHARFAEEEARFRGAPAGVGGGAGAAA